MRGALAVLGLLAATLAIAQYIPPGGGGGSASNTILTGPIASLPSAGTAGRVYFATDSFYDVLRDNGSSWDYFVGGRKVTPPNNSAFSWLNQGAASVSAQTNGAITLLDPANGSANGRLYYFAAPSTPYTRIFRLKINSTPGVNFVRCGVAFYESATGKLATLTVGVGSSAIFVDYWTNATTFSSSPTSWGSMAALQGANGVLLRLGDDGTNLTYSYSVDGVNFISFSTLRAAFFTSAPNNLGLFVDSNNVTWAASETLVSVD